MDSEQKENGKETLTLLSNANEDYESKTDDTQLQHTELISKELLTDEEILKRGISKEHINMYRMQKFKEAFTLDKWINISNLKALTFETVFINVTTNEAKSFLCYCRYIQLEISNTSTSSSLAKQYINNKDIIDKDIKNITNKIDTTLENIGWKNGFFAKFNSRSPKDAFGYDGQNEIVIKEFHNTLDIIKAQNNNTNATVNDALIAWYIATAKLLKMNNGSDVIRIFSRSFRCLEDLQGTLRLGEEYMDISIALRKWNDYVPITPHGEYRCFVHNKKLNAITQYLSNMYFKQLNDNKEKIKKRILYFYENKVKKYVPMDSFVIDFLVLDEDVNDDENKDGIFVIELNPFYKSAGSGLFSWKDNRELFMNGPCQIRVRNELDPIGLKYMHNSWVKSFENYQEMENGDDCTCKIM